MLIGTGNETRTVRETAAGTQERAQAFTRLYEARAYLVYNLALRIACERDTALAAAESAFLKQAEDNASEDTLVPAVATAAIAQAARKPKPGGVGEEELELLRAAAALPAPERAALALTIMADLPVVETAAALQVGEDAGAELVQRATNGFAAAAGIEPGAVYDRYVEWGWAEPPAELWERVYPAFRRAVERTATATAAAAGAAGEPKQARAERRPGSRRRLVKLGSVVLVAAAAAGAVAATQGSGGAAGSDNGAAQPALNATPSAVPDTSAAVPLPEASGTGSTDPVAAMQSKPHKPLTPKELDQLRLKELAALRNYQRRQTDKRLTDAQRNYAAKKVEAYRTLAQEREKVRRDAKLVAARERALERAQRQLEARRRKEAAAHAKQQNADASSPSESESSPPSSPTPAPQQSGSGSNNGSGNGPATNDEEQCVQDTESGEYICPAG